MKNRQKSNTTLAGAFLTLPFLVLVGCSARNSAEAAPEHPPVHAVDEAIDRISGKVANLAGDFLGQSSSYFNQYISERKKDDYLISGKVYQADDDNARLCYIESKGQEKIAVRGTMERVKGDIRLIYEAPDKTETVLADSEDSDRDPLTVSAELETADGVGVFRFDGNGTEAVFRFELSFSGCSSRNLRYLTRYDGSSSPEKEDPSGAELSGKERSDAKDSSEKSDPSSEQSAHAREEPLPQEALIESRSDTLTDVPKPYTALTLDFKEPTEVQLEASLKAEQTADWLSLGSFRLTCEDENGRTLTLAEHEETDHALGGFLWSTSYSKKILFPAGKSKIVLSPIQGRNYRLSLDIQVHAAN